ncbi:MAG: phosphoenolpyruvate--protein phosphotransferase [Lachnospiraceae bacterium]|jgi:phosphotransferase system enzyme I (PtsI)|nr:phosphoenolpyruvate--protein phosphotransferase [Lachnospiraceae bacterium]MEE3461220.1 phosphoenolpyruvate--protein phosphotransferase [Lachnospiraceae bacterium]
MEKVTGLKTVGGTGIGKIKYFVKDESQVTRKHVNDTAAEFARYEAARDKAKDQLAGLYEKAVKEIGEDSAEIFNVHSMFLDDDDYNDSVKNIIDSQEVNAEYAVAQTGDNFSEMFANMDDEYFSARSADIKDVSERVVNVLLGKSDDTDLTSDGPIILVAEELAPSDTMQMDMSNVVGLVMKFGSTTSHTAIIARNMGIPAIMGVDINEAWDGKSAVIDGDTPVLILDPEDAVIADYQKKVEEQDKRKALLKELVGKENISKSGKKINIFANIGRPEDMGLVLQNDAGGIGLFRSEFLYLECSDYPTEDEQFAAYKKVAESMGGKKVVIRTLDIGADKQVDYFKLDKEDNPAMGLRAIRICLKRPEIFRTQLRAIYRASAFGTISIMYPMIISVNEVRKIKEISKSVREELTAEGVKIGDVEEGIMIETPAAALMSDELAKEVDFFSIGTNDLTQYTLAIDRQNTKLGDFYDAHHPAVLRFIKMVIENAHKAGIWAGICGELGADTSLTQQYLDWGVDELSVAPGSVLAVRKAVRDAD